MRAMVFREPHAPLKAETREKPEPRDYEVSLRVEACAVCRTDLHVQDAEIPGATYPVVPGHQVVGTVVEKGPASVIEVGERVGVAWLGWACGRCEDCERGDENLCANAQFTGCHRDGGFAEYMLADSRFCFPLGASLDAAAAYSTVRSPR